MHLVGGAGAVGSYVCIREGVENIAYSHVVIQPLQFRIFSVGKKMLMQTDFSQFLPEKWYLKSAKW